MRKAEAFGTCRDTTTIDHAMRNLDFSNQPTEAKMSEYGDYVFHRRFAPELYLGPRGGNGVEVVTEAWNDYIGNVLMMDPDWPSDVNVFVWEDSKAGVFTNLSGDELSREVKEMLVCCMEKHESNAQMARYAGWVMTTNTNSWINSNNNREGFENRTNLGIIDGLFDLITDEACQPSWD